METMVKENVGSAEMGRAQAQMALDAHPIGSRWRHFKGGTYVVTDNTILEDTLEHLVSYRSEQTGYKVSRKLPVFNGDHPIHQVKRFERIE